MTHTDGTLACERRQLLLQHAHSYSHSHGPQDGKMHAELLPDAPTLFSVADSDRTLRVSFAEFLGLCIKVTAT